MFYKLKNVIFVEGRGVMSQKDELFCPILRYKKVSPDELGDAIITKANANICINCPAVKCFYDLSWEKKNEFIKVYQMSRVA